MIRGLAAILVLCGHLRGLFMINFGAVARPSMITKSMYLVGSLGHQAVVVFFVLSGYLVGGSVLRALNSWSWGSYLINRLTRLYAVLVPALILTAILDLASRHLPQGPVYFDHPLPPFTLDPLANRISVPAFLGNLAFLQNICVRPFGSNTPLWSLSNEFWYYLIFPLIIVPVACRSGIRRLPLFGIALLTLISLFTPIGIGFLIWVFGVSLLFFPDLNRMAPGLQRALLGGSAFLIVAALLLGQYVLPERISDLLLGVAVTGALGLILQQARSSAALSAAYARFARTASSCSYTLYAIHFPLLVLIRTAIKVPPLQPTLTAWIEITALGGGVFLCAWALSRVTEARTSDFRRLCQAGVKKLLGQFDRRRLRPG